MWPKIFGTIFAYFRIGFTGPRLKASGTNLVVRNAGDTADAEVTASKVNVSGESVVLNSDALGLAADWKLTIARPAAGMTADVVLTFPVDDGSPNQVLSTDGNGNLSFVSAGSTAANISVDTTTVNFGSTSPITAFTLPANAVLHFVRVLIDVAFSTAATLSVGITGQTSKYMAATDSDLTQAAETRFEVYPAKLPSVTSEAIIITYSANASITGLARVEVGYSIPA